MTDQERIEQLERELDLLKQLVTALQAQIVAHVCQQVTYPVYPTPFPPVPATPPVTIPGYEPSWTPYNPQTTWGEVPLGQVNNGAAAMTVGVGG